MPYITQGKPRGIYGEALKRIENAGIGSEGDLEFLICSLQDIFMTAGHRKFCYTWLRRCWGATAHAAHEFRRRFLDKREDQALIENGDVFFRMKREFEI